MKNTNRALLTSVVALILCCTMLVGSTFAWFTDSVTSATNIIAAGNLDVELSHQDKNGSGEVGSTTKLFDDVALWEPGAVAYENLTVKNAGDLALKYKLALIVANENKVSGENGKGLSEALKIAVVEGGVDTALSREALIASISSWETLADWDDEGALKAGDSETVGIVIYWEPTANDNDWNVNNNKTTTDGKALWIDLGINLVATQLMHEDDSFDNTYDEDAVYTDVPTEYLTGVNVDVYDFVNTGLQTGSMTLDFTCYTFDAAEFQGEYPVEIYKDWICDYFVSTDKPLNDGLILAGQYDSYYAGWLGFYAPALTDENNNPIPYPPTPLLGTVTNGGESNWTYEEICDIVEVFKCGLVDTLGLNNGTKVTVELRMLNPNNKNEYKTVCSITVTLTHEVNTANELKAALAKGGLITLTGDFDLTEMLTVPANVTATLDLNGHTITGTDTTEKNFSLIDNRGTLTITGDGKLTAQATVNSGWNRYSAVIANNPGGKLIIEGGTLEHLGGTDMAYGIDNLTNGKGTYAETVINGGTVKSPYRAIRMFLNGVDAQNILTINDGVVEGANKSVWMHDPSKNANSGELTVAENATLKGDVYLFVTAGSTEWPVEVSIANKALSGDSTVLTGNVPAGYAVINDGNKWFVESGEIVSDLSDLATNNDVYLKEGNYTLPSVSNGDVTISGTKDTVITVGKPNYSGSDVTFNGVTIKGSGYATGVQHVNTVTYNDATIVGVMCLYGEKVVFNNCTFDLTAVTDYIWTYGAKEVEFNNCTFNTNGKAILIYNEGVDLVTKVTVKSCTFNATQSAQASGATAAAIEIDSSLATNGHYTLVTENNTVDSDFSGEWRIKKSGTNNTTVNGTVYNAITIDGVNQ